MIVNLAPASGNWRIWQTLPRRRVGAGEYYVTNTQLNLVMWVSAEWRQQLLQNHTGARFQHTVTSLSSIYHSASDLVASGDAEETSWEQFYAVRGEFTPAMSVDTDFRLRIQLAEKILEKFRYFASKVS